MKINSRMADLLKIVSSRIRAKHIDRVTALLKRGGVIGYPTETVYGLGGDATNKDTLQRIFAIKDRPVDSPFSVLVFEKEDVYRLADKVTKKAEKIIDAFWPGSLTLVFQAKSGLPAFLVGNKNRIAVRISPDPICHAIMTVFLKPLVSTSANISGKPPARSASEVMHYFDNQVDLVVDGGIRKGKPSTVLDVSGERIRFIRSGSILREHIERILGDEISL
jgi:L-threonylcarbamoyladenylate synthase